jgi:hypothetical protein
LAGALSAMKDNGFMRTLGTIVMLAILYVLCVPPLGLLASVYGPANVHHPLRRTVSVFEVPFRWLQAQPPLDVPLEGYVRWCARMMDRLAGDRVFSRAVPHEWVVGRER